MDWDTFMKYFILSAIGFTGPVVQSILEYREAKKEGKKGWPFRMNNETKKPDKP